MTCDREASSQSLLTGDTAARTHPLLIVSNVRVHAEGLRSTLAVRLGYDINVVSSESCTSSYMGHVAPRLLLVDSSSVNGASLACALADVLITAPLVVYAVTGERPNDVLAFAALHATGFVPHDASVEELHDVIEAVLDGHVRNPSWVTELLVREWGQKARVEVTEEPLLRLTVRQKEAILFRAAGLSCKETAKRMGIAPKTVQNETHAGYRKLGVHNAQEAAELLKVSVCPWERQVPKRSVRHALGPVVGPD